MLSKFNTEQLDTIEHTEGNTDKRGTVVMGNTMTEAITVIRGQ